MIEFKALLIDLDGVIYVENELVPGAVEALARIRRRGIPYRFLTNTSTRGRAGLVAKLAGYGIPADTSHIICPPYAAARYLRSLGSPRCAVFARPDALREFDGLPLVEAGAEWLVLGDLEDDWTFARMNHALRLLLGGAQLIALGMTRYWRASDGMRLDVGPFAAALTYATGVQPLVLGKPDAGFFRLAVEDMQARPEDAAMIGDDVLTDIAGAQSAGLRGILVRTGKFKPSDLGGPTCPDEIVNSIAELPV
ncbi:MAG: TIGR01458 family HAD-type hydrolase [Chloroflexi bacterium]|nr:TIGR01458 family HAD-type hydrolase [Chloroflexota bacterium]MBI3761573.1 TIGR01458 family HAD-type hydrolase [Chloroflexota bacterium]